MSGLTQKQENFCQAFIRLADKSAAYREAYNCQNMAAETINRKAFDLYNNGKIRARIDFLTEELKNRSDIDTDELVQLLTAMTRFDIGELYDEKGCFKPMNQLSPIARKMITQIETVEVYSGTGKKRVKTSEIKKVRLSPLDSIEKLMRYFGAYKKDNEQKEDITIVWHEQKTYDHQNKD